MRGPHLVVAGILFSLFGALGCVQGIGGRCVQDSDCPSGAHCMPPGPVGGVCTSNTTVVMRPDSGMSVDSGGGDARDATTDLMSHDAAGDRSPADAHADSATDGPGGNDGSSADAHADSATDR